MSTGLRGKRILVIEDEYFIASDLKRALTAAGAEVAGPSGQVREGLDLIAGPNLDAAVLDVNVEGELSFAIADELAARGVPYVFVTGYDDWSLPEGYRDTPRLAKPFQMHIVLDTLERLANPVS